MYNKQSSFRPLRLGVLIFFIILLLAIVASIYIYLEAMSLKSVNMEHTKDIIIEQTAIVEIEKIELFTSEESYHVLLGKDEENQEKVIFYPLKGKQKNITTIDVNDIISKKTIQNKWESECEGCTLIHIKPGMISNEALWELAYYNHNEQYVLEYYSMDDGTFKEGLRFSSLFK